MAVDTVGSQLEVVGQFNSYSPKFANSAGKHRSIIGSPKRHQSVAGLWLFCNAGDGTVGPPLLDAPLTEDTRAAPAHEARMTAHSGEGAFQTAIAERRA